MAGQRILLRDEAGRTHAVEIDAAGTVTVEGVALAVEPAADGSLVVSGSRRARVWTAAAGETRWVFVAGAVFTFEIDQAGQGRRRAPAHQGALAAPMPATVRRIAVAPGEAVRRGDVLIVLEAMKMELPVRAPADGTIAAVNCREGERVQAGQELVTLAP